MSARARRLARGDQRLEHGGVIIEPARESLGSRDLPFVEQLDDRIVDRLRRGERL